jgi:Domain of unknown function (DUF4214)
VARTPLSAAQGRLRGVLAGSRTPHNDADSAAILRAVYIVFLGREPDREGLRAHQGRLRGGESWETVLASIVRSDEFLHRHQGTATVVDVEAVVRGAYRLLLRRDPDAASLEHHVAALQRGQPVDRLLAELLATHELVDAQSAIDERLNPGGRHREDLAVKRRLKALEESVARLNDERT